MKLKIDRNKMIAGLQSVQSVVGTRVTLPVLSNVRLRADGSQLELTTTDLDMTVTCTVSAQVATAGATTLPAKKLFGIMRELEATDVELDVNDRQICALASGTSRYKIHGISADDFPPIPKPAEAAQITISQEQFAGLLRRTSFAISVDESRYVLNGVFFSIKGQSLTAVATDGRRLALGCLDLETATPQDGEFIVPAKAVEAVARLLGSEGSVQIRFSRENATFVFQKDGSNIQMITKLVEGNYPNYQQVIPHESKERVVLPREELLHAIRRAELMTNEKSNSVKLSFAKDSLTISANAPEIGEAQESMNIKYGGSPMAIAFNPTYLLEPLNNLTEDDVTIELLDELSPAVIKVEKPFLFVIMPMRLA